MGFGTRIREETEFKPKPMINIGQTNTMAYNEIISHFGFHNFILTLGYKSRNYKKLFLNYDHLNNDIEIKLGKNNQVKFLSENTSDDSKWKLILSETGLNSLQVIDCG